jgi:hypothetical protein
MLKIKQFLYTHKEQILIVFGSLSLFLGLKASYMMFMVTGQDQWIQAQRLWTKALLSIIFYLYLYIKLPTQTDYKPQLVVKLINNGLFAYMYFLILIAIKVICSSLFHLSGTVSGSFSLYYWFSVLIGLVYFIYTSKNLVKVVNVKIKEFLIKFKEIIL